MNNNGKIRGRIPARKEDIFERGGEFGCIAVGKHVVGYLHEDPKQIGSIVVPESVRKSVHPNIMTVTSVGSLIKIKVKVGDWIYLRGAISLSNSKKKDGNPLHWAIEEHVLGVIPKKERVEAE